MFWLDYITSIEDLIVKRKPFNFSEACGVPIWYNSKYAIPKIIPGLKEGLNLLVICWIVGLFPDGKQRRDNY